MAKARKSAGSKGMAKDPHPEQALAELGRRLADPLHAVCLKGEERYFRDQGVRLVLQTARRRGDEICRHDGSDPEFSQATLLDDLTSGALFAGARTILVDNADISHTNATGVTPPEMVLSTTTLVPLSCTPWLVPVAFVHVPASTSLAASINQPPGRLSTPMQVFPP